MKHREKVAHLLRLERARTLLNATASAMDFNTPQRRAISNALDEIRPVRDQLLNEVRDAKVKR